MAHDDAPSPLDPLWGRESGYVRAKSRISLKRDEDRFEG
jgi:hypothetical protein